MTDKGGPKTSDLVRRLLLDDEIDSEIRAEIERLDDADIQAAGRAMAWEFNHQDMIDRVQIKLGITRKTASKLVRQRLADLSNMIQTDIKDILRIAIILGIERRKIFQQMALKEGDYNAANRIEDGILKVGEFFGANEAIQVEYTIENREAEILANVKEVLGITDGDDE